MLIKFLDLESEHLLEVGTYSRLGTYEMYAGFTFTFVSFAVPVFIVADGSFEYTDSTGTDLHDFIIKTLKNPR